MPAAPTKPVTGKAAMIRVLKKEGGPMKMKDLAAKALALKGVQLKGKTPSASLAALVYVDAKKDDGIFIKLDRGLIGLRERDGGKGRS